jgi:arginine-tRNA-protein transferase
LLTPKFYKSLLDRGWRRSGTLLYKPDQKSSCCPHYTIRLDSHAFRASKGQRQTLNRFNKHILGNTYIKEAARLYPRSREQAKRLNTDFDLLERVHESENEKLNVPPEPAHSFTVALEPDTFTEEKYVLFENYQRIVHHEPPSRISKKGFKNFLCSSPLLRSTETSDGCGRRFGSYHQCYRIDGELMALGVLDLLPECVSAVYFMYHESVHELGFGKLGALREIALAEEWGCRWWYAGFYIHNCVKMKYKGDYSPQYILDPESYSWDLLDGEVKHKLDALKYLSLSRAKKEPAGTLHPPSADLSVETMSVDEWEPEEVEEVDSDNEPPVPNPDLPLFKRSVPGILTKSQLLNDVNLDRIRLRIRTVEVEACDLLSWETSNIDSPYSIKGRIAELAAAVGPNLAKEMVLEFE